MKYAFALAAVAGLAAAQPHIGHAHLHKKAPAMETVTDWTVVTVTDVVTVYGPSPVSEPTEAPAAPPVAQEPASSQAPAQAPPAPVSSQAPPQQAPQQAPSQQAPPAPQSPSVQPKPAQPTSAQAPPAPAQSSSAPSGGNGDGSTGGGSSSGSFGKMPGASVEASCPKDKPCQAGMTMYETGLGACGYTDTAPNNQDTVALQQDMFGNGQSKGPDQPPDVTLCNKKIQITNPKTGATAVGTIRDRCSGCTGSGGLDLSEPLWNKLNDGAPGDRVPVEWYFL